MSETHSPGDDSVVYLTTLPNEPLAQMWAETLRRNGIPVLVRPQGPGFAAWGSVFSFDHELHVRADDLPQAREIVDELSREDEDAAAV